MDIENKIKIITAILNKILVTNHIDDYGREFEITDFNKFIPFDKDITDLLNQLNKE